MFRPLGGPLPDVDLRLADPECHGHPARRAGRLSGGGAPRSLPRFIADQIEAQTGGLSHRGVERMDGEAAAGVSLGDIAVLYRNLRLASAVEKVFAERGIPFRQVELSAWYMQGACRLLSSWLMLAASGDGVDQMLFLLGQEAGLGAVRLGQAQALLRGSREAGLPGLLDALAGMRTAPAGFLHLAQEVAALAEGDRPLPELVDTLIGFLAAHYGKAFTPEDARSRSEERRVGKECRSRWSP